MRRRLLIIFAVLACGFLVVIAALPLWLGVGLRSFGPSRGLTFSRYERLGYARFALHDAEYRRGNVRVVVAHAEADTPLLWSWRHWRRSDEPIIADGWRVEVEKTTTPSTPQPANAARGWRPLQALLDKIATGLDRWLPRARVGAGVVRFPGGEIQLASAKWEKREIVLDGVAYRALTVNATAAFAAGGDIRVKATTKDKADLPLTANLEARGEVVTGNVTVWDQALALQGKFGPSGWLPAEAAIRAEGWDLPADKLKLAQAYTRVRGAAKIDWQTDHFAADINATSVPRSDQKAPPLEVALRGHGDFTAFTIEALQAIVPGVTARLSEPVTIERSGKLRESAARLAVEIDLEKQPWIQAKGRANGEAHVVTTGTAAPSVDFSLQARSIAAHDVALSSVDAHGRFEWPRVVIRDATVVGGEGERLVVQGGWDIKAREVLDAKVNGQIRRASIARWLPKQPEFDVIQIEAKASGPVATLAHQGNMRAQGVKAPSVNATNIIAEWSGRGATVEQLKLEATAGHSKVALTGRGDRQGVTVTALQFAQGDATRLALAEPATIRWSPRLEVTALHLVGGKSDLHAAASLGPSGHVEIAAHEIASTWLTDFIASSGPAWTLSLLGLTGTWDRGPMKFSLSAGASLEIGDNRSAAVVASARGDRDGVQIEALRASEGTATVINAAGRVPLVVTPGQAPSWHFDANGPLQLEASVAPNSAFWEKLSTLTGVTLGEPQAAAHLTGTWQRPVGNATLRAAKVTVDPKRFTRPLPSIENLDVQLTGDRGGIVLEKFTLAVEGQAVRAEGRLPVPDGKWDQLFKQPLGTLEQGADFRVEVPDADVAVFLRFLPAVLAPKGRLQADVHYKSGGFEGFLKLRDAASRPLGPLGVLQEISADVALSGRKLALRGVTARSGGQPVTLSGTIELPEKGEPRFDLGLRGDNLPFVRQTGLLLRGDLDLKLQTPASGPPRISGSVRLRDSLFLSDVRAFLPKGGTTNPARRPPYFAVDTPAVSNWQLAVDLTGDRFMRLRTPVFIGVTSARFRLGGTLGEPRVTGDLSIDEGKVRMPFASFEVGQGSVRLTEADPFEPMIYLRGTGRRYGYDLTMEIDGTAAQPNVTFTSSPPLDTDQVLLMVMTGAAPTNGVSSATQRVANIGVFLGSSLLSSLGSDAADADRLTIATGEKISDKGRETYEIEYRLSDRLTLTGERNEFDEVNAGLKWRLFRGKRAGEKEGELNAKK